MRFDRTRKQLSPSTKHCSSATEVSLNRVRTELNLVAVKPQAQNFLGSTSAMTPFLYRNFAMLDRIYQHIDSLNQVECK